MHQKVSRAKIKFTKYMQYFPLNSSSTTEAEYCYFINVLAEKVF